MSIQVQELRALLATTEALRERFEATQPTSQRLSILTKDCANLRRALAQAEAAQ